MDEPNILIKTALDEAVQKVNAGMHPSEALKKVANDLDLNPNYIQRAGEALNVALHYKHFKTASDRSMDFEIANIPEVIQDVFSSQEKTAAEYASDHFSSNEGNDTVFNYNRMLSNPLYKKAFMEIVDTSASYDENPTTFRTVYEKAANYIDRLGKEKQDAEIAKVAAEMELNSQFCDLSDYFKRDAGYRTSFEEFESQVFSKHGEEAVPYIELLHKVACPNEERGVHDAGYIMFQQCKEARLFDNLMQAAADMVSAEKQASELSHTLKYEQDYLKEAHKLLGKQAEEDTEVDHLPPIKESKKEDAVEEKEEHEEEECEDCDPVMLEVKKKALKAKGQTEKKETPEHEQTEELQEKEAAFGSHSVGESFVSSILGGFGRGLSSLAGGVAASVHKPATDAFMDSFRSHPPGLPKPNLTLDNMERKLLLQELMLTDPILSKVNPAKVARAFEQILRLSPEISKEKEVVRAELRAMVSTQALGKFDADLMSKLDTQMLKRRALTQMYNAGKLDNIRL